MIISHEACAACRNTLNHGCDVEIEFGIEFELSLDRFSPLAVNCVRLYRAAMQ